MSTVLGLATHWTTALAAPPAVGTQPSSQAVCAGATASFSSDATGSPDAPTVQWQVSTDNGLTWNSAPGASTTSPYTFATTASQNGYQYRALWTNSGGSTPSNAAILTIGDPAITANPTDQAAFTGDSVTFTVAATGSPAPTLQWKASTDGGTTYGNVPSATSATFSHNVALAENGYKFEAVATNTCGSATSTPATLSVTAPTTATSLSPSANPVAPSTPVTFTATVTKNSGPPGPPQQPQATPTGTVQFSIDGSTFGSPVAIDVNGIAASGSTSWPSASSHTITAVYSGDSTFGGSSANPLVENVGQASTTTLGASANPSVFGQAVTWTATVASSPPGGATPTGTVQFAVDGVNLGPAVALSGGVATSPASSTLSVGNHAVTTTYSGDTNFRTSTASPLTQMVSQAATTLSLTGAPNPSPFLTSVTFTAQIKVTVPGAGVPTGVVVFSDGGTTIGIATLSGGTATMSTNALTIASHNITAVYGGDVNFTPASRVIVQQVVFPQGGYFIAFDDGYVTAFGTAVNRGSMGGMSLNAPIVGIAATPRGGGYFLAAADGGVFAFGDAVYHGSMGAVRLNRPIVGIAATPDGGGYWLVASDGGIFSFGNASFHGSTGNIRLNKPVVGMAAMPDGNGYWMVASDGGIFSFGSAIFRGSTGNIRLNQPVVGMAPTRTGNGYWMVASDGGIFSFGDARFFGSTGNIRLVAPITGMSATIDSGGYWMVGQDGGIFRFGDAPYQGSTGVDGGPSPSVGLAGMSTAG